MDVCASNNSCTINDLTRTNKKYVQIRKILGHADWKLQKKLKGAHASLELTNARHTTLSIFLQIPAILFPCKLQVISHFSLGSGSR